MDFLLQIQCNRLTADLWGGLGPSEGYLLFFAGTFEEGAVIRSPKLGSERVQPPGGAAYQRENWSKMRWPVDLIARESEEEANELTSRDRQTAQALHEALSPEARRHVPEMHRTLGAKMADQFLSDDKTSVDPDVYAAFEAVWHPCANNIMGGVPDFDDEQEYYSRRASWTSGNPYLQDLTLPEPMEILLRLYMSDVFGIDSIANFPILRDDLARGDFTRTMAYGSAF